MKWNGLKLVIRHSGERISAWNYFFTKQSQFVMSLKNLCELAFWKRPGMLVEDCKTHTLAQMVVRNATTLNLMYIT